MTHLRIDLDLTRVSASNLTRNRRNYDEFTPNLRHSFFLILCKLDKSPSYAVLDSLKYMFQPVDEIQYISDKIIHILASKKPRMAYETSPKRSVSKYSDGLISFQEFMIFMTVTDRFDSCPLCNAFSHINQELIFMIIFNFTIKHGLSLWILEPRRRPEEVSNQKFTYSTRWIITMVALNKILPSLSVFLLKPSHADIVKQLTEVIKANSSLASNREFVGSSATLFAPIFEYGCWCYSAFKNKGLAKGCDSVPF